MSIKYFSLFCTITWNIFIKWQNAKRMLLIKILVTRNILNREIIFQFKFNLLENELCERNNSWTNELDVEYAGALWLNYLICGSGTSDIMWFIQLSHETQWNKTNQTPISRTLVVHSCRYINLNNKWKVRRKPTLENYLSKGWTSNIN